MKTKQKLNSLALTGSILVFFMILFSSTASASTIYVEPNDENTAIQDAVNIARSGDIIKVAPGAYFEDVVIKGKSLSIQGSKLPTIQGFDISSGGSATINGFHIIKNGVYIESGCNRIMNNVFDNSQYGLYISSSAFNKAKCCPTVSKNTFKGCETAIYIDVSKNPGRILSFKNNRYINCGVNIGGSWLS